MTDAVKKALLERYPTPFYTFDAGVLRARVAYLKAHLPQEIELCYAVKANTFISPYIADMIDRYEVCSPGELAICTEQEIAPEKLVISGVYKTPELIEGHIASDNCAGHYTAESLEQFALLKTAAHETGKKIKILLRLTSGNQFGMNEEDIENIVKAEKNNAEIDICGIQFFSGTQKTSLKKYKREITHLSEFLNKLKTVYDFDAKELEYGTGFPVYYFEGEKAFDEDAFLASFTEILNTLEYDCHITLELGRSIAASCGCYFTKAVDIKTNHAQNYAIMDGGIHHLTYFGQFMAMKHPNHEIYPPREGEAVEWNLCGSLCTVNDILVKGLPIADFKIGDTVIFKNTGAYCVTEGISLFLSRALPAVIMVDENGETKQLRGNAETYKLNY
ncbi:MAG: alanine racemase [Clostridia bacterium]|nr:alanine racemase [Clostridia bacterium]